MSLKVTQVWGRRRGLSLSPPQQQQPFMYLKAVTMFYLQFLQKKTQPFLAISANRPLLSTPLSALLPVLHFASLLNHAARQWTPSQHQLGPSQCQGGNQGYTT